MAKIITKWITDSAITKDKVNSDVAGLGLIGGDGAALEVAILDDGGLQALSGAAEEGLGILFDPVTSNAMETSVSGLKFNVDDSSIEIGGTGIRIKNGGVTNEMLSGAISDDKLAETYIKADGTVAFTGEVDGGGNKITNIGNATNPNDAVTYAQLNGVATNTSYRHPVDLADTTNLTLPTGNVTIDGIAVDGGDFVLFTNITAPTVDDKIYTAEGAVGAITGWHIREVQEVKTGSTSTDKEGRDATNGTASNGDTIWVTDGTLNKGKRSTFNGTEWVFTGGNEYISAGIGLSRAGDVLNVNMGAGITALPSDEVGIDLQTDGGLTLTDVATSGQLRLQLDETNPGLEIVPSEGLNIKISDSSLTLDASGIKIVPQSSNGEVTIMEKFTLDGTDETNEYVDLTNIPVNAESVMVMVIGGPMQENDIDYNLITDGADVKRVSWTGLGLSLANNKLKSGDVLQITYTYITVV
jgi:hypothetical protein